jgi:uncharacterized protein (TIGR02246 family)
LLQLQRLRTLVAAGLAVLLCALAPAAAAQAPAEAQLTARLAEYETVVRRMLHDKAAEFFTDKGEVSHADATPVVGREAIRGFLKSFAAYKVLDYKLVADSTQVDGNTARQAGSFAQTVTLPQGNTVQVRGLFEAHWVRDGDTGPWRLARLHTMPPPAQ